MPLPDASRLSKYSGAPLSSRLNELGLTARTIRTETLRGDDLKSPLVPDRPASISSDPTDVALRVLFCGIESSRDEVRSALGLDCFDELEQAGLLTGVDPVHGPFHLRTAGRLYLFSDYLANDPDAVMGAGETTAILYNAARPSGRAGRVLDLGCGAGTLALLLARDAEFAVGTDVNPRAIALARLNAAVNGIQNVEFRLGSLYEPVRGESFDILVSQPPYYPRDPDQEELTFLHGGVRGDELPRAVVDGCLDHLASSGRALVFTSWAPDSPPLANDRARILEFYTDRGELTGTFQAIDVLEPRGERKAVFERVEVSPERWGTVDADAVTERFRAADLLSSGDDVLLEARLQLAPSLSPLQEEGQILLRTPFGGWKPVAAQTWKVAQAVSAAGSGLSAGVVETTSIREAVRCGILLVG